MYCILYINVLYIGIMYWNHFSYMCPLSIPLPYAGSTKNNQGPAPCEPKIRHQMYNYYSTSDWLCRYKQARNKFEKIDLWYHCTES